MILPILASENREQLLHPLVALPALGLIVLLCGVVFPRFPRLLIAFATIGPALLAILALIGGILTRNVLTSVSVLPFFTIAVLLIRCLSQQPERPVR